MYVNAIYVKSLIVIESKYPSSVSMFKVSLRIFIAEVHSLSTHYIGNQNAYCLKSF